MLSLAVSTAAAHPYAAAYFLLYVANPLPVVWLAAKGAVAAVRFMFGR